MSPVTMNLIQASADFWNLFGVFLTLLLVIPTLLLLTRGWLWDKKAGSPEENAIDPAATEVLYPGIDPADYASAADHLAAFDRLGQLPQIRRLIDGTLLEWGSGARIVPCDCRRPPVPHLMISWRNGVNQGIVTKQGLAHYVAYQERVATVLLGGSLPGLPASLPSPPSSPSPASPDSETH